MRRLAVTLTAFIIGALGLTGFAASALAPAASAAIPATAPCGVSPATAAPVTYSHVALIMGRHDPDLHGDGVAKLRRPLRVRMLRVNRDLRCTRGSCWPRARTPTRRPWA